MAQIVCNPSDNFDIGGGQGSSGSYLDLKDQNAGTAVVILCNNVAATTGRADCHVTQPPPGSTINKVTIFYEVSCEDGGADPFAGGTYPSVNPVVRPGGGAPYAGTQYQMTGADYVNTNQSQPPGTHGAPTGWKNFVWTVDPSTGLAFTIASLLTAVFGVHTSAPAVTGNHPAVTVNDWYLIVDYNPATSAAEESVRHLASTYLRFFVHGRQPVELEVPAEWASWGDGDILWLAHDLGPNPKGDGWKNKTWARRALLVLEYEDDLENRCVHYYCLDLRLFYCSFWEVAITDVGWTPDGQGVARFDMGAGFSIARNETGYIDRPDGFIQDIAAGALKYSKDGIVLEAEPTTNLLHQSSFVNLTGIWTILVTDTGASIAADATDYLYDTSGLRQSVKLIGATSADGGGAGNTGSRIVYQGISGVGFGTVSAGVEVAMPANQLFRIYVDYVNNTNAPGHFLDYRVVIQTGANEGAELLTWTPLPVKTTKGGRPFVSPVLKNTTGSANQFYVEVRIRGTGNPTAHLYTVEVRQVAGSEASVIPATFGTRRVHTTGVQAARIADVYSHANPLTAQVVDPAKGYFYGRYVPYFDLSDLQSPDMRLLGLWLYTGLTFHDQLRYFKDAQGNGWLQFVRSVANPGPGGGWTDYVIQAAFTIVAGASFDLAVRWTGSAGELDLPPYSLSFLLNGVLQGTVQYVADQTIPVSWQLTAIAASPGPQETAATNVSTALNTLRKTSGGSGAWNAGASSQQTIVSGNGFVEWTVETQTDVVACGLSNSDPDTNFATIGYCGYADGTGLFKVYELGVLKFTSAAGVVQSGSRIRIAVEGQDVVYYVDGILQWRHAGAAPAYPLMADASLFNITAGPPAGNAVKQVCLCGPSLGMNVAAVPAGQDEPSSLIFCNGGQQYPGYGAPLQPIKAYQWGSGAWSVREFGTIAPYDQELAKKPG